VEKSIIYYVTKNKKKPSINLKPWLKKKVVHSPQGDNIDLKITVKNLTFAELDKIEPSLKKFKLAILLFFVKTGEFAKIKKLIPKDEFLHAIPKYIFLPANDFKRIRNYGNLCEGIVLKSDDFDSKNLGWLAYLTLLNEHYYHQIDEMANRIDKTSQIMESVFDLARSELTDATEAGKAFERILDYESQVRETEYTSRVAYEQLSQFRDQEIFALRQQLDAEERLRNFHRAQKKGFLEIQEATNSLLEFSHRENEEKTKFLEAQEKLRALTEQEIRTLHAENKQLKEKLNELSKK